MVVSDTGRVPCSRFGRGIGGALAVAAYDIGTPGAVAGIDNSGAVDSIDEFGGCSDSPLTSVSITTTITHRTAEAPTKHFECKI
jgi:hypothetical protein